MASSCVDMEARASIEALKTTIEENRTQVFSLTNNVQKIRTYLQEVASALWGDDKLRNNGVRSKVAEHEKRLDEMDTAIRHYIDAERRETCFGLAACAECDAKKKADEKEVKEVTTATVTAQVNMKALILASAIPATISALVTILVTLLSKGNVK